MTFGTPEGEQGLNMARLVVLRIGLPLSVAGVTVNRFCGSSMQAIHMAAGAIQLGAGEVFLCAGVESMTRVPIPGFNPMPNPKLAEDVPGAYMAMGITAENLARKYQITRAAQEEMAVVSHQRAAAAQEEGRLKDEIVAIQVDSGVVTADGTIRPDTTKEGLAQLKPSFDANGTVTAGTSSPLTDGASATLVVSEDYAKAHGLKVLARIRAVAVNGCAPEIMGIGPVEATRKALQRAGLTLKDIDVIELNEAFAAQSLAVLKDLDLDPAKVNPNGGAIAHGHPIGATGAILTTRLIHSMRRDGLKKGVVTLCIGGGQGIALALEIV